jgi:hypothetical protein
MASLIHDINNNNLVVKTWNVGSINNKVLCELFWDHFLKKWIEFDRISPFSKDKYDFIGIVINSYFDKINKIINQYKEIKNLNNSKKSLYSNVNILRYFEKYYSIADKIGNDLINNKNIIYFVQELNKPIINFLNVKLKAKNFKLCLLDKCSFYTTGIIYSTELYDLEDKNILSLHDYFGSYYVNTIKHLWEQNKMNSYDGRDEILENLSRSDKEYHWIWKEFRDNTVDRTNQNNILSVLIKNKTSNKIFLCLNIHNPCWWIDKFNKEEIYNKDILYFLRNLSIHDCINNIITEIEDKENLNVIFAGDLNIDSNSNSELSNHLDGIIKSSEIDILKKRFKLLNINPNFFDSNFELRNVHYKYYPVKYDEALRFYTHINRKNQKKILDRIYISDNIKIFNDKKILERTKYSDHLILQVRISY